MDEPNDKCSQSDNNANNIWYLDHKGGTNKSSFEMHHLYMDTLLMLEIYMKYYMS